MHQRDTFKSPEYWDQIIQHLASARDSFEEAVANPDNASYADQERLRCAIFDYSLHLLIAQYSRGADIATLASLYPPLVAALEMYYTLLRDPPSFTTLDDYVHALWLVSLGILLDASQTMIERVVRLIRNDGRDALYERLVALRIADRPATTTLLHPRPYEFLFRALDAETPERLTLIEQFLKRYYRGMRHVYWHDLHVLSPGSFFGYWCFELAAFVKMLHISDQAFADNIYYPRDLVALSSH